MYVMYAMLIASNYGSDLFGAIRLQFCGSGCVVVLMAANNVEKPISKWPNNSPSKYEACLKSVLFDVKQIYDFYKGVGRLVDTAGDFLWFEVMPLITKSSQINSFVDFIRV